MRPDAESRGHQYPPTASQLEAQFRYGGSDGFINWVDNTLEMKRTGERPLEPFRTFRFRILDSPEELDTAIRAKSNEGFCFTADGGILLAVVGTKSGWDIG